MNLFKRMHYSMYNIKKYGELIQASMFQTILYGMFILGLTIAVLFGTVYIAFRTTYGSVDRMIETEIPEFELKDQSLYLKEPYFVNDGTNFVYLDTGDPGAFGGLHMNRIEQMADEYANLIIADKDRMVFRMMGGTLSVVEFRNLPEGEHYSKQDILETIPLIRGVLIASFVFMGILMMAFYFIMLFLISVAEHIFSSIFGIRHTIPTIFKVAIHASTPVCVFFLISLFFGFSSYYVNWVMIIMLFITMQMALRHIRYEREMYDEQKTAMQGEERKDGKEMTLLKDENHTLLQDVSQPEDSQSEKEDGYRRHQPDVIIPSSGWSFGSDEQTKE